MATDTTLATSSSRNLWVSAQLLGLLATVALLVGLLLAPAVSLAILWNVLIPLVPLSLLVSPALWRNVCPLATLNLAANRETGGRSMTQALLPAAELLGIALLVALVPARRFLFNTNGLVLAITITAVALMALALGRLFGRKAGFCNSICPVLPVERLYGQHPLFRLGNPRCPPCESCTPRTCLDVNPHESIAHTMRSSRASRHWLLSGYGVFAAAFPGFVIGYFTIPNGPLESAGAVYLNVLLWMAGSYLATALAVLLLGASSTHATTALAAVAVGLYYWFAAEGITSGFELASVSTIAIRAVALSIVGYWLLRASRVSATPLPGNSGRP